MSLMTAGAAAWRRAASGDPYWDYVVSLVNFTGDDDDDEFPDAKGALELSSIGGASIQGDALYLPNANASTPEAYVDSQAPAPAALSTGADPMCLEFSFFVREQATYWPTSGGSYQCILSNDGTGGAQTNGFDVLNEGSGVRLQFVRASGVGQAVTFESSTELPLATWHHVALSYDGSTLRMFENGVMVGSSSSGAGWVRPSGSRPFVFGRRFNPSFSGNRTYFLGSIRGFRFTRGVERYTSNFSPPAFPLPAGR